MIITCPYNSTIRSYSRFPCGVRLSTVAAKRCGDLRGVRRGDGEQALQASLRGVWLHPRLKRPVAPGWCVYYGAVHLLTLLCFTGDEGQEAAETPRRPQHYRRFSSATASSTLMGTTPRMSYALKMEGSIIIQGIVEGRCCANVYQITVKPARKIFHK